MFDFLKFFKSDKEPSSANIAADRLKLVLVHDRSNCSPDVLEKVRESFLKSLSGIIDIDEENLDIRITNDFDDETGKPALVANIPIKNIKREKK